MQSNAIYVEELILRSIVRRLRILWNDRVADATEHQPFCVMGMQLHDIAECRHAIL